MQERYQLRLELCPNLENPLVWPANIYYGLRVIGQDPKTSDICGTFKFVPNRKKSLQLRDLPVIYDTFQ